MQKNGTAVIIAKQGDLYTPLAVEDISAEDCACPAAIARIKAALPAAELHLSLDRLAMVFAYRDVVQYDTGQDTIPIVDLDSASVLDTIVVRSSSRL